MAYILILVKTIINAFITSQSGCFIHKWTTKRFMFLNIKRYILISQTVTVQYVNKRCYKLLLTHKYYFLGRIFSPPLELFGSFFSCCSECRAAVGDPKV